MRRVLAIAALAAGVLMLLAPTAQAVVKKVFTFTGSEQTFTVPDGVHRVALAAIGGAGGDAAGASGGEGAALTGGATVVTPGQTLYIEVGGNGQSQAEGGAGGFNGGGAATGEGGGGGGGATDVRTSPRADGLSPDTRLIVAAGGGGAGGTGPEGPGGNGGAAGEAGQTSTGGNGGGGEGEEPGGGEPANPAAAASAERAPSVSAGPAAGEKQVRMAVAVVAAAITAAEAEAAAAHSEAAAEAAARRSPKACRSSSPTPRTISGDRCPISVLRRSRSRRPSKAPRSPRDRR